MLIDAREVASDTALRADLCIIGGGAAGIAIARALIGSGIDVLLLESGEFTADARQQELYDGDNVGLPLLRGTSVVDLKSARLRFLGGTTNHWAGWCRTLDPIDFESRSHLDISGWPFDLDELLPYYERAAEVIQLAGADFTPEHWATQGVGTPLPATASVQTDVLQIKGTFSFGTTYRGELERADNISLCVWANATELVTSDNAAEVTSVRVATLSGNQFTVEARAYVLATGGIDVARVLLASNRVRPAGIGNERDLVGRHFTEHLHVPAGLAVFTVANPVARFYLGGTPVTVQRPGTPAAVTVTPQGVLRLTDDVVRDEGLLGMEASLLGVPVVGGTEVFPDAAVDVEEVRALLSTEATSPDTAVVLVALQCEQSLVPDSRVTLLRETDELGVPKVQLDWRIGSSDRDHIRRGSSLLAQALGELGAARLRAVPGEYPLALLEAMGLGAADVSVLQPDGDDFAVGIGFHHMCTARMDEDPNRGVVDPDAKVHGVANLFIASSAIFPTGGSATPTTTITALALRLADHLRETVLR